MEGINLGCICILYASVKNVQYKESRMRDESRELGRGCLRHVPPGSEVADPPELLHGRSLGLWSFSFVRSEAYLALRCEVRAEALLELPSFRKSASL